jgi:SAM-dependent methyltransferase
MLEALPVERVKCPYCSGQALAPWLDGVTDRLGIAQGTYTFLRCKECDSALLSPAPTSEELAGLYPEVYSFHPSVAKGSKLKGLAARLEEQVFFRPQYRMQYRTMDAVLGPPAPDARLLDLGCGVGQRLLAFRERGYAVHGLDFLPSVVSYLKDELGIDATCGNLLQLDHLFGASSFDVVTAFQVVEHVHDVQALLKSCFRLLRPRGWFMATIPMGNSLQATVLKERWCGVREAPRHLNLPSHEGLRRACAASGFENLQILSDSLLNCAGLVGLSLLPDAATTKVYAGNSVRSVVNRVVAAGVTFAALPLCYVESHLLNRPATALVFAQKPAAPQA